VATYEEDLARFLADLDLQKHDAELSEAEQRLADECAVKKLIPLFEGLGYDRDQALEQIRRSGRFETYFANRSD
jgi:hypothetical protein